MKSVSDVYQLVRSRIMSGHYRPGSHLPESELSAELDVSRTPVRAALRRLGEDGLVKVVPHRGAFVAEWTRSDIDEVYELRTLLESRAAGLAAARRSDENVRELAALVEEMGRIVESRRPGFRDELMRNNREFHLLVLRSAKSPRLYSIARALADASVALGTWFHYDSDDIARSLLHHREIVHAIELGNAVPARALMAAHLETAHDAFMRRCMPPGPGEDGSASGAAGGAATA
jgi:DNA-binding GntR family transcriptional regulator